MFSRQTFSSYLNTRFYFRVALDNIINLVDFICSKRWESLFDLNNLRSIGVLFQNLGIQFLELFRYIGQFDVLEIFGDLVNLLLQFGKNSVMILKS